MTQTQPANVTDLAEHRLDAVFSALSDPVRRSILEMIADRELLVSEIASAFDISLQAVSRHIQVRAGLVQQQRSGRISRCRIETGPLYDAAVWLNRYTQYWQDQFDLLATLLDTGPAPTREEKRS
jgi:DNA-binding transcriptional ArsR family regulator